VRDVSGEPHQGSDLVCVHRSSDPFDLGFVKSVLESSGVPFVVFGESVATSMGLPVAFGPAEVMVARPDADDARALLDEARQGTDRRT
jgi:hypothetical protein